MTGQLSTDNGVEKISHILMRRCQNVAAGKAVSILRFCNANVLLLLLAEKSVRVEADDLE